MSTCLLTKEKKRVPQSNGVTYFVDRKSLYLSAKNFLAASARAGAIEMEYGRSRHSTADSGVIGKLVSN